MRDENRSEVAEAVRRALVDAALEAYEDAGIRGLCAEGRWDVAVDALRNLDLRRVVERADTLPDRGDDASVPSADTDPTLPEII